VVLAALLANCSAAASNSAAKLSLPWAAVAITTAAASRAWAVQPILPYDAKAWIASGEETCGLAEFTALERDNATSLKGVGDAHRHACPPQQPIRLGGHLLGGLEICAAQ
jgi:hypothetical protein